MKKSLGSLRMRQVEESLKPWTNLTVRRSPAGGWIRSIREALGMSPSQLGRRMGLTRQGVADLERREVSRGATLAALDKVAEALNAELVYAIVPKTSLTRMLREQVRKRAEEQLNRVAHSMHLEAQGVLSDEHQHQLADREDHLLRTWSRAIWDEEEPSPRAK